MNFQNMSAEEEINFVLNNEAMNFAVNGEALNLIANNESINFVSKTGTTNKDPIVMAPNVGTDEHSPSLCSSGSTNSVLASSSPIETLTSVQMTNKGNIGAHHGNTFKISSKQLVTRNKQKYRLIRKSPLKSSPIKNLTHILRKHTRKNKTRGISPRKLHFILPKVTKFSPRKGKCHRILKSKPLPALPNDISKAHKGQHCSQAKKSLEEEFRGVSLQVMNETPSIDPKPVNEESNSNPNLRMEEVVGKEQTSSRSEEDNEEENEDEEVDDVDQQQQEEHLAAFLKASSTIASQRSAERRGSSISREPKVTKQQKRLQDRITALSYVPDLKSQQDALVLNYLIQVREEFTSVDANKFDEFISLLNGISANADPIEHVYYEVMEILKDFPDLREGFVMFLRPDQAIRVGKYAEYCMVHRMREFVDELKHHLSRQPQNMQKVLRTLQTLLGQQDVTSEQLLSALTPVLKLQPWLLESLSRCFPSAKPHPSVGDDFEEINLERPFSPDEFENINLIDDEVKTTSENCLCDCHSTTNVQPSSTLSESFKSEHCISCGLRFIDGRVFVQCGKTLRLAKVTYLSKGKEEDSNPSTLRGKKEGRQSGADKGSRSSKMVHKPSSGDALEGEKPKKGRKPKKN